MRIALALVLLLVPVLAWAQAPIQLTQIDEVKDLKAFQALMKPVYASVEQQVGKEFMDRLTTRAAQAAR
jgi:hypothetical protein